MPFFSIFNNLPLIIGAALLGLVVGSFLNVVIYRLPLILKDEHEKDCFEFFQNSPIVYMLLKLAIPRSHCPNCKNTIVWWQNIPLISYFILGGKCNSCQINIPKRYPLVEILCCLTTILVTIHFGLNYETLLVLILTWALIAAVFIDLEHQLLPDQITLPLIWLGLLANTNNIFTSPTYAIIGAASAYLFLWFIAKIFLIIRKIDGMGYGDFKLFAVFGAWLGWQLLPLIILASSLIGAAVGITLIFYKKLPLNQRLPFGPYLATAGWLAFFWGQPLLSWYMNHY